MPEGSSLEDIVFITKDGLTTEVDIEVNITATSRTAQIGMFLVFLTLLCDK